MPEQFNTQMPVPFFEISNKAIAFLIQLELALKNSNILLESNWDLDHLCYRTQTDDEYSFLKKCFLQFSKLLIESEVNGRLISTFKLNQPVVYNDWQVDLIELPAPKKGKLTRSGFEHAEVVCDVPLSDLQDCFSKNPNVKIDSSGLKKPYNRELEINLLGNVNIKFHQCSLESVVTLESNYLTWKTLCDSRVLEIFSDYDPLVAGTFPLGIANRSSDVDIVLALKSTSQIEHFISYCQHHFAGFAHYQIRQYENIDDLPTVILNFEYNGIAFEVFAQARPSVRQKAYLHYLVEERLLKYGGDSFRRKIIEARLQGLKTEPAFAEVLGIEDDPYERLLKIQKLSFREFNLFLRRY